MAAKPPNISFTLPMSCQICLGKVKQPVLCPNFHVFCQLCLDIWMQRNRQCPACRIDITTENPIKHIIGGQHVEESQKCMSTPDMRRARMDLLYIEYEDAMEGLKKENLVLRTETDILSAQLKDADDQIEKFKSGSSSKEVASSSSSEASALAVKKGPSLLQLTRNLKEAQKLYSEIKVEMTRLKQENIKMRDENVNFTRENDNLRLEIAQRSPKKFGRYTVATLETKLAEATNEIRQLTSALERSDSYIEDLEEKIKNMSTGNKDPTVDEIDGTLFSSAEAPSRKPGSGIGKIFQFKEEIGNSEGARPKGILNKGPSASSSSQSVESAESAKRVLFGKEFPKFDLALPVMASTHQPTVWKSTSGAQTSSYNGENPNPPEREPQQFLFGKPVSQPGPFQKKKVTFERTVENSTQSFELDMPSPDMVVKPLNGDIRSNKRMGFGFPLGGQKPMTGDVSHKKRQEHFDKQVANLLQKSSSILPPQDIREDSSSRDVNDSSRLSLPDSSPYNDQDHEDHLDISMTPELNDCLQLMDRAERNVHRPSSTSVQHSSVSSSAAANMPGSTQFAEQSAMGNSHFVNQQGGRSQPPPRVPQASLHSATVIATPAGGGMASSGTMWEKDFYSSVKSNPYKVSVTGVNNGSGNHNSYNNTNGSDPYYNNVAVKREAMESYSNYGQPLSSRNEQASNGVPPHYASSESQNNEYIDFSGNKFDFSSRVSVNGNSNPSSYASRQPPSSSYDYESPRPLPDYHSNKSLDNSDLDWPDSVSDLKSEWPDEVNGSPSPRFEAPKGYNGKQNNSKKRSGSGSRATKRRPSVSPRDDSYLSEPGSGRSAESSDFLSEPKKRGFDTRGDMDFEILPNKTTRR